MGGGWGAGAAYPRVLRSHLLRQSRTFLSKSKTELNNCTRSSESQLYSANIWHKMHTPPVQTWKRWIELIRGGLRFKSEKHWKGSLSEWIADLIKTISRVAMKWKYGDKRDMWCCPEWTGGLEAVLEPNYVFVQFWKRREKAKLPPLLTRLNNKNSKWGFSLKSFTGQTPSWPLLPQKLCPNWSNQLTPCAQRYL